MDGAGEVPAHTRQTRIPEEVLQVAIGHIAGVTAMPAGSFRVARFFASDAFDHGDAATLREGAHTARAEMVELRGRLVSSNFTAGTAVLVAFDDAQQAAQRFLVAVAVLALSSRDAAGVFLQLLAEALSVSFDPEPAHAAVEESDEDAGDRLPPRLLQINRVILRHGPTAASRELLAA